MQRSIFLSTKIDKHEKIVLAMKRYLNAHFFCKQLCLKRLVAQPGKKIPDCKTQSGTQGYQENWLGYFRGCGPDVAGP
jgi:hypothetical protein